MNDCQILIVGTTHPIQMRAWSVEQLTCEAFERQLIEWCRSKNVDAVAEEMSALARERARDEGTSTLTRRFLRAL